MSIYQADADGNLVRTYPPRGGVVEDEVVETESPEAVAEEEEATAEANEPEKTSRRPKASTKSEPVVTDEPTEAAS